MNILSLDPATHTGWAHSNGPSGTFDLSVRRDESSGMRLIRLSSKLDEIANSLGIHLVVFEAARHSMPGMQGALVVQSEIQGLIKFWCEKNGINYRGYSPSEIKKHATGKGNSGKPVMLDFAKKKWPDKQFVTNSKGEIDDNEVDAVWLLDLARIEYDSKSED